MRFFVPIGLIAGLLSSPVLAAESVTYSYDAKGRLVRVVRSGTVNSGVVTTYDHDAANNRKKVTTTGAR